jgi:hypothetical protein
VAQDRLSEKTLFQQLGIPLPAFFAIATRDELAAKAAVGLPCILKTRRLGYDGKGQFRLRSGPTSTPPGMPGRAGEWWADPRLRAVRARGQRGGRAWPRWRIPAWPLTATGMSTACCRPAWPRTVRGAG